MSFFNRNRISPDFIAVPAEPSRAELSDGHQIDREVVVAAFDRLALEAFQAGAQRVVDAILDERAAIKPVRRAEVPVIPGRPS